MPSTNSGLRIFEKLSSRKGRANPQDEGRRLGPIFAERRNPQVSPGGSRRPVGSAVKVLLDDPDASKSPIGAQASATIYTNRETGAWAALRKISLRAHSWFNWLYPMPF
jgi:hypothetical protein